MRLYVVEGWTSNIYVFDPVSKTLLDSMYADYANGLALSPDGQHLFTTHDAPPMPGRQVLKKVQTETLEIVGEMPGIGQLLFLEQGEILLRRRRSTLEYINPTTFQISEIDSIALRGIAASDTTGLIIGAGTGSDWRTIAYDFRNKRILAADSIRLPDGAIAHGMCMAFHPSGQYGFGIFRDSYQRAWFMEFSIPTLEIEIALQLVYEYGDLAVSPDGRHVLFNDPGDPWRGNPLHRFYIYSVHQRQITHLINTDTLTLLRDFPDALAASIDFSPDGNKAYVSCGNNAATGPILYFDMEQLRFVDELHAGFDWNPGSFAVGYEP